MKNKNKMSDKNTVWVVSNCNRTNGAIVRAQYAESLLQNGLKLDGYGIGSEKFKMFPARFRELQSKYITQEIFFMH